jgi:hypothetical protein
MQMKVLNRSKVDRRVMPLVIAIHVASRLPSAINNCFEKHNFVILLKTQFHKDIVKQSIQNHNNTIRFIITIISTIKLTTQNTHKQHKCKIQLIPTTNKRLHPTQNQRPTFRRHATPIIASHSIFHRICVATMCMF